MWGHSRAGRTPHFAPRVERLETRDVPAGNVNVAVGGGLLSITGDSLDNQIGVQMDSGGGIIVYGLGSTTVNGVAAVFPGRGVPDVVAIDLGAGADYLEVGWLFSGVLYIQGGAGPDWIRLWNTTSFGNTEVIGGEGNDVISLSGVLAYGILALDGQSGADALHVDNTGGLRGAFAVNFEAFF